MTEEQFRVGLEIARRGGTRERPYDQTQLGSPTCGSACCIVGHAYAAAGVTDYREWVWPSLKQDSSPWFRSALNIANGKGLDCLKLIDALDAEGDLIGVYMPGSDLRGVNLSFIDLTGAVFNNACLSSVYFYRTDLTRVDFRRADLRGANFHNCCLDKTNMRHALLSSVNFFDCDTRRAVLEDTTNKDNT